MLLKTAIATLGLSGKLDSDEAPVSRRLTPVDTFPIRCITDFASNSASAGAKTGLEGRIRASGLPQKSLGRAAGGRASPLTETPRER